MARREQIKEAEFLNDLREEEKRILGDTNDLVQKIFKRTAEIFELKDQDLELQKKITQTTGEERDFFVEKRKEIQESIRLKRQENDESKQVLDVTQDIYQVKLRTNKVLAKNQEQIQGFLDKAKKVGDTIEETIKGIPFIGNFLIDKLELKDFGDRLSNTMLKGITRGIEQGQGTTASFKRGFKGVQAELSAGRDRALSFANNLSKGGRASRAIGAAMRLALGPIGLAVAAAAGLFMLFRKIDKAARDLANELSLGRDQLDGQLRNLKLQELRFKALNLDADKLKGTLTTLSEEFRDLSLVTAENAANIEKFAQNSGIAGTEVAKLNKKLMVMEGLSFDAALSMQQQAASMAKAEGLAVGRVLSDMASAAEEFARFSRDGADGLAEAAVAAAKLGLSLDGVLKASEGLLDFESSITKEFEAQVLTGQALNLERARQAALAGDQEGLLQEIRSIAMGVNVESMNVVQKDAIAGAIGISVADLMRVSRGESLDKQQTQIDEQKKTNEILINGFTENTDELKKIEENQQQAGSGANNLTGVQFEVSS